MESNRLEAFSDGVLAIIITIMVLELEVPHEATFSALWHTTGVGLLSYLLSFVYVGIYWNNHHHLFQITDRVDGGVLWANLALLFTLSLLPFTTAWLDATHRARAPVITYGVNLLAAAIGFFLLEHMIARIPEQRERLRAVFKGTFKERVSIVFYLLGIVLAMVTRPWVGIVPFVIVALLWVIPDRRVERYLAAQSG